MYHKLVLMVAIPSSPQLHLLVAEVVEPLELLPQVKMADQVVARRVVLALQTAVVLVIHLLLLHPKAITVAIVVRRLLTQIMLAVAVAEPVVLVAMLLLADRAVVVLAAMEVQALPHHFQALLLLTHGAVLAADTITAIQELPLLDHKEEQKVNQHLRTQVAAVMVALKPHG
jgi:hypothetical protein